MRFIRCRLGLHEWGAPRWPLSKKASDEPYMVRWCKHCIRVLVIEPVWPDYDYLDEPAA